MREKTARLRRLLNEGYSIVDIDSDAGAIDMTLRKDDSAVRLRFYKSEAEELLYMTKAA